MTPRTLSAVPPPAETRENGFAVEVGEDADRPGTVGVEVRVPKKWLGGLAKLPWKSILAVLLPLGVVGGSVGVAKIQDDQAPIVVAAPTSEAPASAKAVGDLAERTKALEVEASDTKSKVAESNVKADAALRLLERVDGKLDRIDRRIDHMNDRRRR